MVWASLTVAAPKPEVLTELLASGRYREAPEGLEKFCSCCRDYWPADSEFFKPNKGHRDGLETLCRACRSR